MSSGGLGSFEGVRLRAVPRYFRTIYPALLLFLLTSLSGQFLLFPRLLIVWLTHS